MGDSATAMRDPIFYRWHAYIDDIFQEFKSTIPSYSVQNVTTMSLYYTLKINLNHKCFLVGLRQRKCAKCRSNSNWVTAE